MRTKLYPERNMRRTHPFKIWMVLQRMRVLNKISDTEPQYYDSKFIGSQLFSNWSELSDLTQSYVVVKKLHLPLFFLQLENWIALDPNLSPSDEKRWRVRKNSFETVPGFTTEMATMAVRNCIDDRWREFIS